MNEMLAQLCTAFPEVILLGMICFTLVVDSFLVERYRFITYYFVQLSLVLAFFAALPQFNQYLTPHYIFSQHYVIDRLAVLSKLFIYFFCFFAFIYARDYLASRNIDRGSYYLLGLFAVLGMSIMASAYSFLTIYLGLELLSLALYAMVAMNK